MLEDKWVVDVDLPPNLLIHRVDERLQKLGRFNFFININLNLTHLFTTLRIMVLSIIRPSVCPFIIWTENSVASQGFGSGLILTGSESNLSGQTGSGANLSKQTES